MQKQAGECCSTSPGVYRIDARRHSLKAFSENVLKLRAGQGGAELPFQPTCPATKLGCFRYLTSTGCAPPLILTFGFPSCVSATLRLW